MCFPGLFENGWPSRRGLVTAQDDIDIERVEFHAAAASASSFSSDEGRSRPEEWIEDDVAAIRHIKQRILQHRAGFHSWMLSQTFSSLRSHAGGAWIVPDVRTP